jgi:hypothetical protein
MHQKNQQWVGALVASVVFGGCGASNPDDLAESGTAITIDTSATYTLTGVQSGKCVEVAGGSTANLAQIQIATCNGSTRQRFRMESQGSGYYRMRNVNSNLCVDVSGASTADGARVIQYTCGSGANQQWSFTDVSTGVVRVAARHSGKLLDVQGRSTADNTPILQWPSTGATNQQFRVQAVSGSAGGSGGAAGGGSTGGGGTPTGPQVGRSCTDFATVDMGKYWVNNNIWGRSSGSGSQCVWGIGSSTNPVAWGTSWSWSGQTNSVKSYASTVLGWHWGWRLQNTGLPVQLSANRNVNTGWTYNVTMNGTNTLNVAYDLWLHTISNPTWEHNPTDEVMIWLYRSNGAGPIGTRQVTVNIAGTSWDLYRGNIGWNVFSFVRTSNTTSSTLNLRDFLNDLVSRGWMSSSKYLTSVQAGTEVFIGTGQLDTTSYYCNVE